MSYLLALFLALFRAPTTDTNDGASCSDTSSHDDSCDGERSGASAGADPVLDLQYEVSQARLEVFAGAAQAAQACDVLRMRP